MPTKLDVTRIPPGTVLLGKYRVLRTVGVGGMGAVVACDHRALGTQVALKFLLPRFLSDRALARRFVREAQSANRIHSEHVARIMDVDQLPNGLPFIVMEYLEGSNLAALLKAGREFPVAEAVDCAVQAAEALAQAHRVGVVHRDVKPSNLFLVEPPGEPAVLKVVDFGISKVMGEPEEGFQGALTDTSTVLGSGLYMSPEQMRSSKDVDQRTDIYGLGLCLYELLTHTLPYTADSFADLCVKVRTEPPVPLRQHRPDLSPRLDEVVARAYAVKPADRYQTAADFAAALAPFATPETRRLIDAVQRMGAPRIPAAVIATPSVTAGVAGQPLAAAAHSPTAATRVEGSGPPPPLRAVDSTSTAGSLSLHSTAASLGRKIVPWALLGTCVVAGGIAALLLFGRPKSEPARTDPTTAYPSPAASGAPNAGSAGQPSGSSEVRGPEAPPDEPADADAGRDPSRLGPLPAGAGTRSSAASPSASAISSATAAPSGAASAMPSASAPSTAGPGDTGAPTSPEPTAAPASDPDVRCLLTDPVTGEQKQVPCQ